MAKPTRMFNANVGQRSINTAGPDQIEYDLDNIFAMFNPLATLRDGSPGGISAENIKQVETANNLPTTGLTVPDLRIVKNPTGDGKTPPTIYIWDGVQWRAIGNTVIDYTGKFDASTGHKHTGATGDAPLIPKTSIEADPFNATTGHKHTGVVGDGPILPEFYDRGVNVKWFGATGSSKATTGSITSESNLLTVASIEDFKVGDGINVAGAGVNDKFLVSKIVNISGNIITLQHSATTTVTNAIVRHDDTRSFIDCFNYINSIDGGTVVIPKGYYVITDYIILPPVPVKIVGAGTSTTWIVAFDINYVFGYTNTASVGHYVIKDIYIAAGDNSLLYAFYITGNFHRFLFENIKCVGTKNAAWFMQQCWIGLFLNCYTDLCEQAFSTGDSYVNSVSFIGGEFKGCAQTGKNYAFYINDGYGIYFHNVCIEGNNYGGITLGAVNNATVRDCYFEANKKATETDWVADIELHNGAKGVTIQGNLFDGGGIEHNTFGVLINNASNILIEGNYFTRQDRAAIRIGSDTSIINVRVGLNTNENETYVDNQRSTETTVKIEEW